MDKIKEIKELVELLNTYRNEYYNLARPSVSDLEYDNLFDKLQFLEIETGFILNNSPTQTVGFEVKSKLEKVKHNHPMLSLDKTKSVDEVLKFLDGREGIAMLKMDGLTGSCMYSNRALTGFESRGNGEIGENLLHNAKTISNLPCQINIDNLIVDGEVIIDYDTFDNINSKLSEDEKYKNPRNLASGSIRQLDSKTASERGMRFIAWKVVSGVDSNSFFDRLEQLYDLGFEVVPHHKIKKDITKEELENIIDQLKSYAELEKLPIDGIVFGFDDIDYGASLGQTGHHVRSQIAYKFEDSIEETTLREIKWQGSRTGTLTPVAIFDEVEIDGSDVSRASLHNVSICEGLKLGIGDKIMVYKANMIIPQVDSNLTQSNTFEIPKKCPICGASTEINQENESKVLACTNEHCDSKRLKKFVHFVSKNAMDIDGLSEATLEKFIDKGFLTTFTDIYYLDSYKNEIISMEGMGLKSYTNLIKAIENSKNVKLNAFIYSLGIPQLGKSMSKTIADYFEYDWNKFVQAIENEFDFTKLKDCGEVTSNKIDEWYYDTKERKMWIDLIDELNFVKEEPKVLNDNSVFLGMNIYCTGTFASAKKEQLKQWVEENDGTFANGYAKSLSYLVIGSLKGSTKEDKAKKDGVSILTEQQFLEMIGKG